MARALTAPEIETYRTPGHGTRVQIAIPEYHTIYTAELASAPGSNDQVGEIAFTNGSGTLSNVKADMTLYAGTTAGAYDLGMCRIRKAAIAGTFYIGEISEIDFSYGGTIYLTVVDDYGIWAKPVRLVNGVVKMDYDLDYSDQHTNFDPAPVLGSHKVGELKNGTVTIQLGSSLDTASYVIDSSVSSYLWAIAGASAISSASAARPTATFTAAGTYLAYCTVTGANGKSFQGVRYIVIYDDDHPLLDGILRNYIYDYETGGASWFVDVFAGVEGLRDRSLAILVAEDSVQGTPAALACPIPGSENGLAFGWIGQENIEYGQGFSSAGLTIHNARYWLENMEGYLVGVEFKVGASDAWTNISALTVRKMLHHFFHWRTTATRIMDVVLTDDTRYAAGLKTITGTLWEQIVQIADTTIFARPGVDRFNRLFVEIEPQMVPEADRTYPEVMTIDNQDWIGTVKAQRDPPRVSMLYFSGVSVDTSKYIQAFVSMAPGHIHGRYGRTTAMANYLVTGQAQSNQLCGLYYGWQNGKLEYEIELSTANRMFDLFPRQYINLTIDPTEDPLGIGYSGRAILRRSEYKHDPRTGVLSHFIYLEPETFEALAITGDIPDADGDANIPTLPPLPQLPPLPPVDIIVPGDPGDETVGPARVLIATSNFGVLFTTTFNTDEPQWYFMNAGLGATEKANIYKIVRCPSGALFALTSDGAYHVVYFTAGLGGTWSKVFSADDFPADGLIKAMGVNPNAPEQIAVFGGTRGTTTNHLYLGDRNGLAVTSSGLNSSSRMGDITYGAGKWFLVHTRANIFDTPHWIRFSSTGVKEAEGDIPSGGNATSYYSARGGAVPDILVWNNSGVNGHIRVTDNGSSFSSGNPVNLAGLSSILKSASVSPTGQFMMGGISSTIFQRSSDYGATWGPVDVSLGIGRRVCENCASPNAFIACTTQDVRYTPDWGTSWIDKSGNLPSVAPLCGIAYALFVSW